MVTKIGLNGVLFGLLAKKAVEIGTITPPIGLNAFVVRGMAPDIESTEVFHGCVPFVLVEFIIVGMLVAFPRSPLFVIPH